MSALMRVIENLAAFRRVPIRVVVITALASYVLQIGAIIQGQPLYIIAIFTMLPWIPVVFFESLWKIDHYNWFAVFFILTVLQIGHVGEHLAQVGGLAFFDGTLACPPPLDNEANVARAVEAGLRSPDDLATGISTTWVMQPGADGFPALNSVGEQIRGPAACGVLGQLDIEIVHLVWEIIGWLAILWLLTKFPKNIWLWVALVFASIHTVEHFFISWIFFVETDAIYEGAVQLWGTTIDGRIVTAHPVGLQEQLVTFYSAGGKNGLVGRGGYLESLFFGGQPIFPTRPYLHLYYNLLVTIPFVAGFLVQVRRVYNEYLAKALPGLSEDQLVSTTPMLEPARYEPGELVFEQGELADDLYIISRGEAEVFLKDNGTERVLARLESGQYFGEIGLFNQAPRMASVRAVSKLEVLRLNHRSFLSLMEESELSQQEVERLMQYRLEKAEEVQQAKGAA